LSENRVIFSSMETISLLSTILPARAASTGGKSSVSIDAAIRASIEAADPARVFSPADFTGLGSRAAVDKVLSRLAASGELRRITRGLYDRPEVPSSMPSTEKIARALAGNKNGLRLQESGAYAANLLGLSESMPSKIEFMTDGAARTAWIGDRQLVLKPATPRNMATAGRISGLVIQALRHLKQRNVDESVLQHLQARLSAVDKAVLLEDAPLAPAWIAGAMRRIAGQSNRVA
jgi:hypothetical protein